MEETFKILVIDDDAVDRMAVRRALSKADVDVDLSEVEDGETALSMVKMDQYDCIFIDYLLPDYNGLDLVKKLQQLGMDTPLVVLTGQGDEQIAVDVMKAGAADYVAKARVSPASLARTVRRAIRLHRAEQAAQTATQKLQDSNDQLRHQNHELAQQQAQIESQNQELIKAYRLKSEFIATISHELRTPMNAIMGFSQLLLRQYPDPLSEQQLDMVKRIFDNSRNLLGMVNEVLDFSKIEANRLEIHPKEFQLSPLILSTIQELQPLALEKDLALAAKLPDSLLSLQLTTDPDCLRRIIVNLISNAIKFTASGEVTVRARQLNPEQVEIVVQDTGVGISPEHLETIFEPFRQVDQSLTRSHAGTGLGLAITQSLVKAMQGTISVTSQTDKGSTFVVQLPIHVQEVSNGRLISTMI